MGPFSLLIESFFGLKPFYGGLIEEMSSDSSSSSEDDCQTKSFRFNADIINLIIFFHKTEKEI